MRRTKSFLSILSIVLVMTALPQNLVFAGTGQAEDLFISEYIEGSSYNKAIEIYNGTGTMVDLSLYTVELYANNSSGGIAATSTKMSLTGTLNNNATYVIANSSVADATILAKKNITHSVIAFNGNDPVLLKKNGNIIDIVGKMNENPGTAWTDAAYPDYSTLDKTLVRKSSVTKGNTSFSFSEWDLYAKDDTHNLGKHAMGSPSNNKPNSPTADPVSGAVAVGTTINFSTVTSDTTIFFKLNNAISWTSESSITLDESAFIGTTTSAVIDVKATNGELIDSDVSTFTYTKAKAGAVEKRLFQWEL